MKWTVRENSVGLCSGLQLSDLPDTIPASIQIVHKNNTLGVLCENTAGVLPCKNGHEIIIESKCINIHPIEMIVYINNLSGIKITKDTFKTGSSSLSLQSLAESFVDQLLIIKSFNRKLKRIAEPIISNVVVGKVDWMKTIMAQRIKGREEIHSTVRKASYDIPENALIASAAKKVFPLFQIGTPEYDVLFPWVKMDGELGHSYGELFLMQQKLNEQTLSGAHAFYYVPVMLSKMILGFHEAGIRREDDDNILFNMPGLYEEFIRTGMQRVCSKYGFSVQKGFVPRNFLLFDGECEMIPDIAVYEGNNIKALMDVKYKAPDSKDYYQIYAYMKNSKTNEAYVISPEVKHKQIVTTFDGLKIKHIRIDSSNAELLERVTNEIARNIV